MTITAADFWDQIAPKYSQQAIADPETYEEETGDHPTVHGTPYGGSRVWMWYGLNRPHTRPARFQDFSHRRL